MVRYFTVREADEVVTLIKPILGGLVKLYRLGLYDDAKAQLRWLIRAAALNGFKIVNPRLGILHFPTIYRGLYSAYLCYMYGEEHVAHWHRANSSIRLRIIDSGDFENGVNVSGVGRKVY